MDALKMDSSESLGKDSGKPEQPDKNPTTNPKHRGLLSKSSLMISPSLGAELAAIMARKKNEGTDIELFLKYFHEMKARESAGADIYASLANSLAQQAPLLDYTNTLTAKLRKEIAEKEARLASQKEDLNKKLEATLEEKSATEAEKNAVSAKLEGVLKEFEEQRKALSDLQKRKDLGYLLDRVSAAAANRLLNDAEFEKRFEETQTCSAFVLAIDIRRSTDLMLRGKSPQHYARFLNDVCSALAKTIKEHFGIIDKFTGDGLLAYFPDFFTGKDAGYYCLAAAQACHSLFFQHYRKDRNSFTVALKDVGLGIGIDFGEVHLLRVTNELTVVGAPVVYACRLSGAQAGRTLMNHSAVEALLSRCNNFDSNEVDFEVKHEGTIICSDVKLSAVGYKPEPPDWIESSEPAAKETDKK